MKATFKGVNRKKLAEAIAEKNGTEAKYKGVPTFAYEAGEYIIDREGNLEGPDDQGLLTALKDAGFEPTEVEMESTPAEAETAPEATSYAIARESLSDAELENLQKIIASKEALIKKAIGTDTLDIKVGNGSIDFPWFKETPTPEQAMAYRHLILRLCDMARTQKRVTARERVTENERYAFRCFLLRLGFIGKEYKDDRKILLQNLAGSSAFKDGKRKGEEE